MLIIVVKLFHAYKLILEEVNNLIWRVVDLGTRDVLIGSSIQYAGYLRSSENNQGSGLQNSSSILSIYLT